MVTLTTPLERKLFDLLYAALDGIDGYESEYGSLDYWNPRFINEARQTVDRLIAAGAKPPGLAEPGSRTPRP